jgi:hypothetical protein
MSKITELPDKLEKIENGRLEKIKKMRENKDAIEYWEDHGDGGFWKPLTEEKAAKFANDHWELNELRLSLYYLVKTDVGILILNAEEYATYMGNTIILYQGSYTACKDFVKV